MIKIYGLITGDTVIGKVEDNFNMCNARLISFSQHGRLKFRKCTKFSKSTNFEIYQHSILYSIPKEDIRLDILKAYKKEIIENEVKLTKKDRLTWINV